MKTIYKITGILLAFTLIFSSCDEQELIDLNVDPNAVTDMDMQFLFSLATLRIAGEYENTRANVLYAAPMIQHIASLAGYFSGDKYFYNPQYSGAYMERHYTDVIRLYSHVINRTQDDPAEANVNAAATVMRVFDLHRMTDIYGDVPYFQAGRGLEGAENWFPVYDSQQEIYEDMISSLREARGKFSPSARGLGNQDFMYRGDLNQWRKFTNSLLMRIAMRMSEVNPTRAREVFIEANSSGAFESIADNGYIHFTTGPIGVNRNGLNDGLWNTYKYSRDCKISKTFMDWMIENNDPRLMIVSGGLGDPERPDTWNTDPAAQRGMPNGFNSATLRTVLSPQDVALFDTPGVGNRMFSMLNLKYLDWEDPYWLISYAEVEFMKAEAAVLGWISSDASTHFANGITAAINSWVDFDASFARSSAEISAYIAGRGFEAASTQDKLRLIGEEYWAATWLNSIESWANWRRTGFPVLEPTQDPNRFEVNEIPRRLRYWEDEIGNNPQNYRSAVSRIGGDFFMTKTWWDGGN
ncbi:SusD/RagB family nutrient-binding outer membrane lipoprotein [Mongoliitalea daihaiensis]|uniref:SusD/RagB family nutrient-binding outer membrane lipoprotein n=1 Tax=Mongoliitalea daihaiensis TaxID=2782006 RepID=UPI001F2D4432|nr:SusD/RagB family nutrient-binding outer membrane lipoprotein [Mongoliitalea daihaiensis]UJP63253.1 SusD/RagB family nutrient-binding outer membrane lipoprotein [Mongoliitalea daihaiensis]